MLHLILHGMVFVQPLCQGTVDFQSKHVETVQLMEDFYCSKVCGLALGAGLEGCAIVVQSLLLLGGKRNDTGVGQAAPRSRVDIVWWTLILGPVTIHTCCESCCVVRKSTEERTYIELVPRRQVDKANERPWDCLLSASGLRCSA